MKLTLQQRAVIVQLYNRGYDAHAETARTAWSEGRRIAPPREIMLGAPGLLREFERANAQAEANQCSAENNP